LVDGSIDASHISTGAVETAKLAIDAVDGSKLADNAVDSEHYTDASIDTAHYAAGSVDATALGTNAVTTVKINADAVTGAKIADDAIDSEHYTDASIDTAHIADSQVTTAKIADDAITFAKIGCEQTTISDTDTSVPTSGAVVDYVAAQIAPIGGLEVIATDAAFPNTQPASGVVISIADAGGLVVNGSGVSTTGRTVGASTVTINGINSSFYSTTIDAGIGMLVTSTGSGQIYNYHKTVIKESDVAQISDDINDFNSRYRIASSAPGSDNDAGDLYYDTSTDKMYVRNAANNAWGEVTSTGEFKYLFLCPAGGTGAPTLDGSLATYDLRESSNSGSAASITVPFQLLVSINGVVQKANTGTSAPAEGFAIVDGNTIVFGANLASGDSIFIIQFGSALSITTPGDGTVSTAKLAADSVNGTKIADDSINSEHYVDGSIDTAHIADDQVTLAKMAGIARGKIIYGDSSGNPAVLAPGTSGQVLESDGTDISWQNAAAGATGGNSNLNGVFWENQQTVTHDYTIQNNYNAGSFGPITINSGITVTVGAGESWTVI
jgi:hypothetical protein